MGAALAALRAHNFMARQAREPETDTSLVLRLWQAYDQMYEP
jgi:hypothetical protein